MCRNSVIGCECNGETAVTIVAPVRVAPGQNASVISGFDTPTPIGKGK
jgi:hypothetical protein